MSIEDPREKRLRELKEEKVKEAAAKRKAKAKATK